MNSKLKLENFFDTGQTILLEEHNPAITEHDVYEYAKQLGIDVSTEAHLLWIAEEGLTACLPDHYLPVEDEKGQLYYFNTVTSASSWEHPADQYCKQLLREVRLSNQADSQSTIVSGELSLEDSILDEPNMNGTSEHSFLKKVMPPVSALQQPLSVHFDVQSPLDDESSEEVDPELDDMIERFGLLDASSLSPVFVHSPEPEDVNSLLRLTGHSEYPIGDGNSGRLTRPASGFRALLPPTVSPVSNERKTNFLKPLEPVIRKNSLGSPTKSTGALEPILPRTSMKNDTKKQSKKTSLTVPLAKSEIVTDPNKSGSVEDLSGVTSEVEKSVSELKEKLEIHKKELEAQLEEWSKEREKLDSERQQQLEEARAELLKQLAEGKKQVEKEHQTQLVAIRNKFEKQKADLLEQAQLDLEKIKNENDDLLAAQKTKLTEDNKQKINQIEKQLETELELKRKELQEAYNSKLNESEQEILNSSKLEDKKKEMVLDVQKELDTWLTSERSKLEDSKKKTLLDVQKEFDTSLASERSKLNSKHNEDMERIKTEMTLRFEKDATVLEENQKKEMAAMRSKLENQLKLEEDELVKKNSLQLQHFREELEEKFKHEKSLMEENQKNKLEEAEKEARLKIENKNEALEKSFQSELESIKKEFSEQLALQREQLDAEYQDFVEEANKNYEIMKQNKMQEVQVQSESTEKEESEQNPRLETPVETQTLEVPLVASPTPSEQHQQEKELLEMLSALDKHLKSLDEKVDLLHQKPPSQLAGSSRSKTEIGKIEVPSSQSESSTHVVEQQVANSVQNDTQEIASLKQLLHRCQQRLEEIEGSKTETPPVFPVEGQGRNNQQGRRASGRKRQKKKQDFHGLQVCRCCDYLHCCTKSGYQEGLARRARKLAKHMDREAAELAHLECRFSYGLRNHEQHFDDLSSTSSSSTNSIGSVENHQFHYRPLGSRGLSSSRAFSGSRLHHDSSRIKQALFHSIRGQSQPIIPSSTFSNRLMHPDRWDDSIMQAHSHDWWSRKIRNLRDAVKDCEDKRSVFGINANR